MSQENVKEEDTSLQALMASYLGELDKEQRSAQQVDLHMAQGLADVDSTHRTQEEHRTERAEVECWKMVCLRELGAAHFQKEQFQYMNMNALLSQAGTLFADDYGHLCTGRGCTMKHFREGQRFVNVHNAQEVLKATGLVWFCRETGSVHLCGKQRCNKMVIAPKGEGKICPISGSFIACVRRDDRFMDPSQMAREDNSQLCDEKLGRGTRQRSLSTKKYWKRRFRQDEAVDGDGIDYADDGWCGGGDGMSDDNDEMDDRDTFGARCAEDAEDAEDAESGASTTLSFSAGVQQSGANTIQTMCPNTDYNVRTVPQSVATAGALTSVPTSVSTRVVTSNYGAPTTIATTVAPDGAFDSFNSIALSTIGKISSSAASARRVKYGTGSSGVLVGGGSGVGLRARKTGSGGGGGRGVSRRILGKRSRRSSILPPTLSNVAMSMGEGSGDGVNRLHVLDAGVEGGAVNKRVLYDGKYAKRLGDRTQRGEDGILCNIRSTDVNVIESLATKLIFPDNRSDAMDQWLAGKERDADQEVKKVYEAYAPKPPPLREVIRAHSSKTFATYREAYMTFWSDKDNPRALRYFINSLAVLWKIVRSTPYAKPNNPPIKPCITALMYALRDGFEVEVKLFGDQTFAVKDVDDAESAAAAAAGKNHTLVHVVFIPRHDYLRKQLVPQGRTKKTVNVSFMNGHKIIRMCYISVLSMLKGHHIKKIKPFLLEEHMDIEQIQ